MGNFKNDQHIVSDFIVKRFADENGQVVAFNKKEKPVKRFLKAHDKILVKKHANEIKNIDETFFHRNEIEDKFANIEAKFTDTMKSIAQDYTGTRQLTPKEAYDCIILIATQLIRSQKLKQKIIGWSSNLDDKIIKNALYLLALSSKESCIDYLLDNGFKITKEEQLSFNENTLFEDVVLFILLNCAVFIIATDEKFPFVLTDFPVLIDKFSDAKYLFPISPTIAIGCCVFSEASQSMLLGNFIKLPQAMIEKINQYLCDEAEQIIICQQLISDKIYTYLNREGKADD